MAHSPCQAAGSQDGQVPLDLHFLPRLHVRHFPGKRVRAVAGRLAVPGRHRRAAARALSCYLHHQRLAGQAEELVAAASAHLGLPPTVSTFPGVHRPSPAVVFRMQ